MTTNIYTRLTEAQNELSYLRIQLKEANRKVYKSRGLQKRTETMKRDVNTLNQLTASFFDGAIDEDKFKELWVNINEAFKED